ncbi:MAG: hypothetical protein QUU85_11425 [Candidatus Eisenbacteria bacterium]|nr:hypothetical protein [Candidatus Eisenbacteria bacterium]
MTLTYEVQTDGSVVMSSLFPEMARWDMTVSADGRTGTFENFSFVDPSYIRDMRIEWDNCSGAIILYDELGNETDRQTWQAK